jgi:hypothetical protein
MKAFLLACNVKHMDKIDAGANPRFIIKDFGTDTRAVDHSLKVLLPVSKAVTAKQEEEKNTVRMAAKLRGNQELLKTWQKMTQGNDASKYLMGQ